jgi:hypothetical protein
MDGQDDPESERDEQIVDGAPSIAASVLKNSGDLVGTLAEGDDPIRVVVLNDVSLFERGNVRLVQGDVDVRRFVTVHLLRGSVHLVGSDRSTQLPQWRFTVTVEKVVEKSSPTEVSE